jgi:hypothetical protein
MIISTVRFGDLVFEPDLDWFMGTTLWNGQEIRIVFPVNQKTINDSALAAAQTLWSEQVQWQQSIQTYAIYALLGIKNSDWLEDDEDELTAEVFGSRITLETISVATNGEFEFWYNDGDLFWGHSIVVRGNLENGPIEACTEG